jgi:hypothetical protein
MSILGCRAMATPNEYIDINCSIVITYGSFFGAPRRVFRQLNLEICVDYRADEVDNY